MHIDVYTHIAIIYIYIYIYTYIHIYQLCMPYLYAYIIIYLYMIIYYACRCLYTYILFKSQLFKNTFFYIKPVIFWFVKKPYYD